MKYQTKFETVTVGVGQTAVELKIEVIADFNKAIDDMFAELQARGEQEMLTDLCPYFGTVWDSARVLADFLWRNASSICRDKRIFEIGCGLAIPSLVALKSGADKVVASDAHPDVAVFLERNLQANGIAPSLSDNPDFTYCQMDWRMSGGKLLEQGVDYLIGSDILYDQGQAECVARFIEDAFLSGVRKVFLTDPGRPYLQDFVSACDRAGMKSNVEVVRIKPEDQRTDIFLLEITP